MSWSESEIAALRAGESWAVDRMYRENARRVLAWVIRLGGASLDAEDVAHDVFAVALRKVSGFRGDSKLSTWLFGITRGVVANARRRAAFRRFLGLDAVAEPRSELPRPDEITEARQRRRQVQLALEQLSTSHREVVVLCDLEGNTAPEVAEMLGIAVGTVYSRLHHGRKRFRDALDLDALPPLELVSGGER